MRSNLQASIPIQNGLKSNIEIYKFVKYNSKNSLNENINVLGKMRMVYYKLQIFNRKLKDI
jgi:hypothetical protein